MAQTAATHEITKANHSQIWFIVSSLFAVSFTIFLCFQRNLAAVLVSH